MQIFYPYSLQLYPSEFPGEDPRDCPRNVNKEQSVTTVFLSLFIVCFFPSLLFLFHSVLWHCRLDNRKGIWPVRSCVLVCWWWWFDWNFAHLIAPAVIVNFVIFIILSSSKIWNGDVLVLAGTGLPKLSWEMTFKQVLLLLFCWCCCFVVVVLLLLLFLSFFLLSSFHSFFRTSFILFYFFLFLPFHENGQILSILAHGGRDPGANYRPPMYAYAIWLRVTIFGMVSW